MGQARPSSDHKIPAAPVSLHRPLPAPDGHKPVSMRWINGFCVARCPCTWTHRERLIGGPQMSPSLQEQRRHAGQRMDAAIEEHWRQERFKASPLGQAQVQDRAGR